jgi:phosphoglycerol transferase MdoB-like AlkP superfamily enzyme
MSAYDLYHASTDSYYSINKLGVITGFRLDVVRTVTNHEPDETINIHVTMPSFVMPTFPTTVPTEPTKPSTVPTVPGDTQPGVTVPVDTEPTEPPVTAPTEPPIDTSPNILDINFEALIQQTSNRKITQMHQYFMNRTASNKNEYTGIFEGCNLIMITAEAFSTAVITPDRTPTLYKMMTEGIFLENNYVPNWGVSTTDGEYAHLTSTVPKAGVWSFSKSSDNYMPLTMSMQLKELGYNAFAYHGHTYDYYNRNQYLTNLGFYYKGYGGDSNGPGNGLNIKKSWPESDIQVVDQTTSLYVGAEPFVTYYMSISGHGDYTWLGNYIASKNKSQVLDEPYSTAVQAYIATQLEFEASMELLLQRLEEANVLDNTVIVIVADHYPYGLTDEQYSELVGHPLETNFEIFKNGVIIYKPGIEPAVVTAPTSHLDILPTLSNMFGLEFDSRLYMGRDVFSDAMPLVMFRNRSWITDLVAYNADSKKYTYFTDMDIPKEYLDYVNAEVSNRFSISSLILDHDYWRILFG